MFRRIALAFSAMALLFALAGVSSAADNPAPAEAKKINVLLITGGHGFDQKQFFAMFDAFPGMTYKHVEEKVGGEAFESIDDFKYDVIVTYNFNRKISDKQAANFTKLLDKGVGLVILHHAIAAYQDWPEYRKILGARYYLKGETDPDGTKHATCLYKHDVDMKVHVEDPKSPVTAGVSDFTIHDETYKGYTVDPQVKVFLTTDDPTSTKEIGWTNTYRKANVCYLELGHDAKAYASKEMQKLYVQAIQWAASRSAEPAAAKTSAAAPALKFFAAPAEPKKINLLLVTGGHGFEKPAFLALFDAMPGVTYKHVEEKVGGEAFDNIDDFKYDVIVTYNYNRKISDKQAENFTKLLDKGVGLVILHHAIAAYNDWPEYRKILGARYYLKEETDADGTVHKRCQAKHGVDMKAHIEDPKCPVAAGVSDFTIHDEAYKGYTVDPQVKVFLTTDDPASSKAIGWTNTYRKANVCYLELGHDSKAYASKELQALYTQAVKWAAGGAK